MVGRPLRGAAVREVTQMCSGEPPSSRHRALPGPAVS